MKRIHFHFAILNLIVLCSTGWTQTQLSFVLAPKGEVFLDSLVRIAIRPNPPAAKPPDSCALYRSPTPAGNALEGHATRIIAARSLSPDSSAVIFAFKASDNDSGKIGPQLGLGIHHLVAYCPDGKAVSPEIPLWIVTRQAASITAPKAQETSYSPNISWSAVPGVPAYHLLLSDQALDIDTEKGTVGGASIIWQVITTKTGIAYGTPDPSGTFAKVPAPPLSPNVPYNLVILNNYDGRSALATSAKAQGLKLFTIQPSGPALAPSRNLDPTQDKILTVARDSTIAFRWTKAKAGSGGAAANTYRIFIYSLENQDDIDVLFPIWQSEVTDTFAILDAKRTLLSKRYIWKVFAVNESGASVVGDTTSFQFRNDVQTLSLTVRSTATAQGQAGDALALGDVRIDVTPLDGSADPLPLFTTNFGKAEKVLAVGSYSLAFSKDGYLGQTRTVTLGLKAPMNVDQLLPSAEARITGRAVDLSGADLVNANVTASGGGKTVSTATDAQGFFLLGVAAGTHSVSLAKPDYQSRPDTVVSLASGKSADLGKLILARARGSLTGTVVNDKGAPLASCLIIIKTASDAVERSLLTDDKGGFSAFLTPGGYTVIASRSGFTSEQKAVQLTEAINLRFTLASGASLVKGRISILVWPTAAAPQSSPLAGAALELIHLARKTSQKTEADLRGEYSFSADTGAYLLKASRPGKALPESVVVRITTSRSTLNQDLSLQGFASIRGALRISPDTIVNPSAVSVSLLNSATLSVVATATPQSAPESFGLGTLSYSLESVPDGTYRLACGFPGYGLDAEPEITIANGTWRLGLDLTLKKAVKSITFAMTAGGNPAKGSIRLITPQAMELLAGQRLGQAASGTYIFNAQPDSAALIPLSRHSFFLPSTGSVDTTLTLTFPFTYQSAPLSFHNGETPLVLDAQARIDSAVIFYGYGAPIDSFRVPASQLFGPLGPRTLRFRPGPQGGLLTYYFVLKSGLFRYSNEEPARRFQALVTPSRDLASLKIGAGDSLRLPARTRGELHLHAYDAAGRRLDSLVDARGSITWSADASLSIKLDKRSKRTLTYQTSAPTTALGKRNANSAAHGGPTTANGSLASAGWDTLSVTVSLDGIEKTLMLPAKVVPAVINKLVLGSTLGEVADIPAPASFGLYVTGYDTTTTPPTPVIPNPVLTLDPPQAGAISEMQVNLDPRFIGPLRIFAKQVNPDGSEAATELGAYRDSASRGLNVGQTLLPGATAKLIFHDPGFEMLLPDSAFTDKSQAVLRMYKRRVAKTFSSGIAYAVSGSLYEISNPSGAVFAAPPRLTLGVPAATAGRKHAMKRFESMKLDWKDLTDSAKTDTNSFGRAALTAEMEEMEGMDGSYYGLLGASQGLTAGEVEILPNPFSPLVLAARDGNTQYGTRIRLLPESDRSAEVTVSVKIYNRDGELVRLLVDHKTVPKAQVDFYWDGKADGGRWARNGRYLVKISVRTTGSSKTKQIIKPVVVFQ
ncbi:MAG: carboxypeptidase regulatory-like domain-containing protein [Fibrobacterota bacterium]|nr:carboxypeptidase regulatory-like domain-containing protein [Fibrobacterota bacterium]